MNPSDYITTRQAAQLSGCGITTVTTAIRHKILRAVKVRKNKCVHYEIHVLDFRRWDGLMRNEVRHG